MNKIRSLRRPIKSKRNPSTQLLDKLKLLESNFPPEMAEAREVYQLQLVSSFANIPLICYLGTWVTWYHPRLIPSRPLFITIMSINLILSGNVTCITHFFNSTFSDPSSLPPGFPHPDSDFHHLNITESDVYEAQFSLDPQKSSGRDNISPALLKYCAVPLTELLHKLYVMSIHSKPLHDQWKLHLIVPVF